jgi:hypothetical protein
MGQVMYKPTENFILAMTVLLLLVGSLWIIATLYTAAMDRQAQDILDPPMCVSETGHKEVPCPQPGEYK